MAFRVIGEVNPRQERRRGYAMMPLSRFKGGFEVLVDLAGEVSIEASDGFSWGESLGLSTGVVVAGGGVVAQSAQDDGSEGVVCLAVAASVEAVTSLTAAGRVER